MKNTDANLTVIDTFAGSVEHDKDFEKNLFDRFSENIEPYDGRVETMIGKSSEKLKELKCGECFDFIYVDGSHQAKDVLEDAILAFPLLKENGIMIFDDYTWRGGKDQYELPAMGIDAFLFVYANQLNVLAKNQQVVLAKKFKNEIR